jgi:hypothetical protein
MEEHFGSLNELKPLTFTLQREDREEIAKTVEDTEVFFPPIREIEKTTFFADPAENEREKQLFKQVSSMKQLYQTEIAMEYSLADGDQDTVVPQVMQLGAMTMDTARQANLDRLTLRMGPTIADTLRHREEEPVYQNEYRDIASQKASEARDLQILLALQVLQSRQSLRNFGPMPPGHQARSPHRGKRGGSRPNRSTSAPIFGQPRRAARHKPVGKLGSFGNQQVKRYDQPQPVHKPFLGGKRKG